MRSCYERPARFSSLAVRPAARGVVRRAAAGIGPPGALVPPGHPAGRRPRRRRASPRSATRPTSTPIYLPGRRVRPGARRRGRSRLRHATGPDGRGGARPRRSPIPPRRMPRSVYARFGLDFFSEGFDPTPPRFCREARDRRLGRLPRGRAASSSSSWRRRTGSPATACSAGSRNGRPLRR
ncbi:MAG: hypothetical protein M0C28_07280 [Candidatus Moduliflexus flocculans]|nr:hypothetical protein [Candidatus Moduliflexus flocculans]